MGKINLDEMRSLLASGKSQADCSRHFLCSEMAISKAVRRLKAAVLPESMQRLTLKERTFVENLSSGMTPTQSAEAAYDCNSREVARSLGCRMSKDPDIELALADLMSQENIPRRRRIQRLGNLIESNDLSAVSRGLDISFKLDHGYVKDDVKVEINFHDMQVDLAKACEAMRAAQVNIIDMVPEEKA